MRGDINYRRIDIAPFVQDWVNNSSQNYGMLLQMIATNYYNAMIFCSSDYPDSTLWPNLDVCYINGGINGVGADTLCGLVFDDLNGNGTFDGADSAAVNAPILVDGAIYYSDATGYYHIATGAGTHHISLVPPFGWTQTVPAAPVNYTVTTTSGQNICGFDFGMKTVEVGINNISASASNLGIYPNPVSGSVFNLLLPDGFETGNAELNIIDMMGRQVLTSHLTQQKRIEVNIDESVQAGVYLVVVKNASKQICGKITVAR